ATGFIALSVPRVLQVVLAEKAFRYLAEDHPGELVRPGLPDRLPAPSVCRGPGHASPREPLLDAQPPDLPRPIWRHAARDLTAQNVDAGANELGEFITHDRRHRHRAGLFEQRPDLLHPGGHAVGCGEQFLVLRLQLVALAFL